MIKLRLMDEWLFKGLAGVVNMLVRRVGMEPGFSRTCKLMVDSEVGRLISVQREVHSRLDDHPESQETPFSVIDVWFLKSYEGINTWFARRSMEGPTMDPSSIETLQTHISRMQEIVDNERARRNQDHAKTPS